MTANKLKRLKEQLATFSIDSKNHAIEAQNIINLAKDIKKNEDSITPSLAVMYAETISLIDVLVRY